MEPSYCGEILLCMILYFIGGTGRMKDEDVQRSENGHSARVTLGAHPTLSHSFIHSYCLLHIVKKESSFPWR
jgi:hypothetical protein